MKRRLIQYIEKAPARSFGGTIFIFILIEGLFSFCSKTCPAFSDAAFDAWFPYTTNQDLYFTSALQAKDTLRISRIFRSEKSTSGMFHPACYPYAFISADGKSTNAMKLDINYKKETTGAYLSVYLYGFQLDGATFNNQTIEVPPPFTSRFLPNAVINGKSFSNVVEVQQDTVGIKPAGVYKIWLAKGSGVVGYETYPALEQWAKD